MGKVDNVGVIFYLMINTFCLGWILYALLYFDEIYKCNNVLINFNIKDKLYGFEIFNGIIGIMIIFLYGLSIYNKNNEYTIHNSPLQITIIKKIFALIILSMAVSWIEFFMIYTVKKIEIIFNNLDCGRKDISLLSNGVLLKFVLSTVITPICLIFDNTLS